MPVSTSQDLAQQLKNELQSRYSMTASDAWLDRFLATASSRSVPLGSLASTAHFRLLGTDIASTLSSTATQILPLNLSDVQIKEARLSNNVPVQVLDVRDTSSSKWSQLETIERVDRGEEIRGREVIRTVPGAVDEEDNSNEHQSLTTTTQSNARSTGTSSTINNNKKGSTGPHKVLLQDAAGTKIWAFEMTRIEKITIVNSNPSLPGTREASNPVQQEGMQIGCKILLKRGIVVRRGLVMLVPENVIVMGGRVDIWDQKWRQGRKAQLAQELTQESTGDD